MKQSSKKRDRSAKNIGGGSLPLATASSPKAAVSSATPSNGGHPRNAPAQHGSQNKTSLKNAGVILIDCDHNTPKYQTSGKPYVCIPQLKGGRLELENVQKISDTDFVQWTKKAKPTGNDVILSRRCNPGETAHVTDGIEIALGQNLVLLRATKPDMLQPSFLRWVTQGPNWWLQVNQFMNVGAVFTSLKCADIPKFEIYLPSVEDQKRIVSILGTLDDKIALNRRINQTLEAMAQALFQSWFVDFDPVKAKQVALESGGTAKAAELVAMQAISGKNTVELKAFQKSHPEQYAELEATAKLFPSRLVESELGMIPEGWEWRCASKIADIGIGKTPPRNESQWFTNNELDVKWASIRDMGETGTYIITTSERLTEAAVLKFNVRRIPQNTVLLSFKMTVGRVTITTEEMLSNEAIAHFNLLEESSIEAEYLYLYLKAFDYNTLGSTSSIATAVNSKTIRDMLILVPTHGTVCEFEKIVRPIFAGIREIQFENSHLIETRDFLLPKLLSGEISVENIGELQS